MTSESEEPTDEGQSVSEPTVVASDAGEELADDFAAMLAEHHDALPYLFIGSGFSRRYLGLPDWEGLLQIFAEDVGENFNYHLATANGDYPVAASSIAKAFHPHWWNDKKYEAQVEAHQNDAKTRQDGAIKVAIAQFVIEHQELTAGRPGVDDPALAEEVELLRNVVVDGVITTNYDSLTDQLFPSFQPYVGQEELMFSDAQFIGETYKIHGSAERPQSLILTAEDYNDFSERNHYLAAKLLTIFAEHPVLFVGYSLSDKYLGEILGNNATAVGPKRLDELGSRIYFVEWTDDEENPPAIEKANLERGGHRLPITRIETNSFEWIWKALGRLERPFNAGVLRELRKHVYDLVTHPEPGDSRETVRAIPIDAEGAEDVRVVFGVGQFSAKDLEELSSISARTLTRADIERDVLGVRDRMLGAEGVLKHGIPRQIRPTSSVTLPVHKYLFEAGRIDVSGSINYDGLEPIIQQLAERQINSHSRQIVDRFHRDVEGKLLTPRAIMQSPLKMYFKLECLILLDTTTFDIEELREVLVEFYRSELPGANASNISTFRKALVHYDRLSVAARLGSA